MAASGFIDSFLVLREQFGEFKIVNVFDAASGAIADREQREIDQPGRTFVVASGLVGEVGPSGSAGSQGPVGPTGPPGEVSGIMPLSAVQTRRTTDYVLTTSFVDITFDTTDIENNVSTLEHDNVATDRINVGSSGLYLINYDFTIDSDSNGRVDSHVRKNDLTILPGSERCIRDSNDEDDMGNSFLAELDPGDFLSLQLKKSAGTHTAKEDFGLNITKLDGVQGTKGAPGASGSGGGTNVEVQDEGSSLTLAAKKLNFVGAGVTATEPITDEIVITIPGGGGGGGGSGIQMERFDPNQATYPASSPAAATSRNEHPLIAFDDTTAENIVFHGLLSNDYSGGDLIIDIDWVASSATTLDVKWGVEIERIAAGGHDIDADSFAAQQTGVSTTNATSGKITRTSITLTQAQADSITAGDSFRLRVQRVAGDAADDMSGDAQLSRIGMRQ